ncbi:AAA family ATPase [Achromobacter insuavis]|uniref:AAA family ATPase n=1 Tax=Achromobacter insuavis TaxID=1287735 RepID=UPI001F13905D|nr:AAA family ATPase [Achromobacter insuavis]
MRINRITVENFQGARAVDLQLPTPLALVSGLNGAGKSTVAEAVRLALQGTPERVGLKKEYDMLVSDGAKLGAVTVELDAGPVSMTLPKGVADGQELVPTSPALPFVLAPERFALAEANDRRSLLFTLTGAKIRPDDIAARLLARNCSAELVTQIKPILRTGFAAGSKYAKDQATQAKGAWRTVTGEVYGDVKAKDWAADEPAFDRAALESAGAELAGLDERIEATAQSLGKLVQKAEAYAAARDQLAARQAKAARLPELTRKLEYDLAEHGKTVAHVEALQLRAGAGPRTGLVHELAICLDDVYNCEKVNLLLPGPLDSRILEVLERYEAQYGKLDAPGDADAAAALPKAIDARELMARSVENDRRDIAAAQEAAASLEAVNAPEAIDTADVDAVRAQLNAIKEQRKEVHERVQTLLNAKQAADSAKQRTSNAAQYHGEVLAWAKIGDALAPDGIPGEILAEALQPMNDRLARLAELANWPAVAIAGDMAITYGGRAYRLLSESERWRTDALIGLALATQSGLRCVLLDRFDCLDQPGRGDLLGLLDTLAADRELDTALVLGTLKSAPPAPTDLFTSHWIDHGTNAQPALRAAA